MDLNGILDASAHVEAPQPPAEAPAAVAEAPAAVALPNAPWAKDRDELFADTDARAKFDTYMREKQQPYVTKLEQGRADLEERAAWHDDLKADPDAVLRDAVEQVYGAEAAEKFLALIDAGVAPTDAAAMADAVDVPEAKLSAAQQAALDHATAQHEKAVMDDYYAAVAAVVTANPHVKDKAFHHYVAAHGTVDGGLAAYLEDFPAPAAEKPREDPAPRTLSGGGSGAPVIQGHRTLRDAADSVFDALRKG